MFMAAVQLPDHRQIPFLGRRQQLWIDGQWRDPRSGESGDVLDPATGSVIAKCPLGDASDIDDAVRAARRSFDSRVWRGMLPADRARVLWRLADLIESNAAEFANLEGSQQRHADCVRSLDDRRVGALVAAFRRSDDTDLRPQRLCSGVG
jgi:acyl-CoA reductase-like NAD-dependent aldehyde dehydrogenase